MISKKKEFEYAFHNAVLGMCMVSIEGNYLKANEAMCNLLGYTEAELKGKHFKDITFSDDIASSLENHNKALQNHYKTYQFTKRFIHKDGSIVWAIASTILIRDEKGKPIYFFSQIQDITIERQFRKLNKDFEYIFNQSVNGKSFLSLKGNFIKVNRALCEFLGYEEEELTKMSFKDITHPEDIGLCIQKYELSLLHKTKSLQYEKRYIHKDGHIMWAHITTTLVVDEKDRPSYFHTQVQDISIRKKSEMELAEAKALYERAVGGSSIGLWEWNVKTDKLYWSSRIKEMIGIDDKEFTPTLTEVGNIIHPEDLERRNKAFQEHLRYGKLFDCEYRFRHRNGHYIWARVKGEAVRDKKGRIVRVSGSIDDITKRKNSEIKLKEYTKELEAINSNLDSFAYIASHDLQEPLRGISSNVHFLQEDFSELIVPDAERRLNRILLLCERMESLINNLLKFAKLKNRELIMKKVDLNEVIDDIKITMEDSFKIENVKIIAKQKLPKLLCDKITITSALTNLISNGMKYNRSKQKIIEIGYKKILDKDDIQKYVIFVKDNGIGIPKSHHEEVFKIFKRLADFEDKKDNRGTGVGLTFVKKIVERHGGDIWIDSDSGKGTIISFTLC